MPNRENNMFWIVPLPLILFLALCFLGLNCTKRETCGLPTISDCQTWCGVEGVQVFETPSIINCSPRKLSRCQCGR